MMKPKMALAKWLTLPLLTVLLFSGITASAAGGRPGYVNDKLNIISEPGETSEYVSFYKEGEKQDLEALTWVDGRNGQAVQLDGISEYLQVAGAQIKVNAFSFATWINWQGAKDPENPDSLYNQRVFTIARNQDRWFTMSPFLRDPERVDENGKIPNGVYWGFNMGGQNGTLVEQWNPAVDGQESYGLPQNEWHHIAVVSTGQEIQLYIDGRLWSSDLIVTSIAELQAPNMKIGTGIWENPTLNALLDDTAIYQVALTPEQVTRLFNDLDPFSEDPLPEPTTGYVPTSPTTTTVTAPPPTTTASRLDLNKPSPLFGVPTWAMYLIITILVLFVVLSIVLSIIETRWRRKR